MTEIVMNTRQKVKVVFMEKTGSMPIKLIEPADGSSPIQNFALHGGGLHRLCFKCDDINQQIEELDKYKRELRVVVKPQPGEAFENEYIAFALSKHNTNIELIDTDKRAKRLNKGKLFQMNFKTRYILCFILKFMRCPQPFRG